MIYQSNVISIKIQVEFFIEKEKNSPKICMEPQNTSTGHSDLEQGEQSLWHHFFLFQSILQTHSNPNYVVLV